ncbi:hypothetical protein A2U01_0016410, partial [Trifolium medium]|nr:hypothetical protein [Trifolium medium]
MGSGTKFNMKHNVAATALKDCAPPKQKPDVVVVNDGGVTDVDKATTDPANKPSEPTIKSSEPVNTEKQAVINGALNVDSQLIMEDNSNPNFLHGDWIKVERKKRSNKSNKQGGIGFSKGGQVQPQYAKFGFPDNESYINMKKQIQNEDIDSQIAPNQKARNRMKKKKRLDEDTNTSLKADPNKSNNATTTGFNIEINSLVVALLLAILKKIWVLNTPFWLKLGDSLV